MKQGKMKRGGAAPALCVAAAVAISMLASAVAVAQTNDGAPAAAMQAPVANTEIGHSTLAWLDLQRSNTQAAPALPMLGAEAGLAYRRYMESFKSKIPDLYGSALKAGGSGDAGGGSGGALGSGGSGAN
ncbi:DUF3613 domain-containing protein [Paraburkholderia sp. BCC1884]|uniref:DUF3613 domain-containing protein n=1 Tax=Paraburkholderia sp. BCC1884 TaxID=2562668 RepID=UPI0021B2D01B|nr:DUF3613 domain-containing protein [Paraburkholderia sp. BCC1884]